VAGQVWEDVLRTFSYSANPGETAYYGAREMVGRFLEDRNIERPFHEPTDRSNALYWYKTAIKYGDAKAAERYLNKYKDLGGTMKGLKISVDRAHPLAALPNKYRTKFLNELSQEDRETVKRASRWYKETFKR
jgi:TPR repeat protein